ncbi:MAG: aminotransferase class IV [Gammaproteobacteria bacterium]|nr:aminotransferase class IV [Gammaproteobacteria bacterium]
MPNRKIWRDGEFIAWEDATVHVLAQSLQRGSLAFDYISVHEARRGTAIFRLRDHIERLETTCRIVGLPLEYAVDELVDACAETVRRNPGVKSVKISALMPSVEAELIPENPHVAVFIAAYDSDRDFPSPNADLRRRRRQAVSLKIEREKSGRREDIIPPHAKVAANYTAAMTAKWRARNEGFDDIVLLDEHGNLTEGPTANLFLVGADGNLATPPASKVLLGITRDSIIALAPAVGRQCVERDIAVDELGSAAEVFLSGTSAGVWPVVSIDGNQVRDGRIGPATSQLRDKYRAVVLGAEPAFEHWLHYV